MRPLITVLALTLAACGSGIKKADDGDPDGNNAVNSQNNGATASNARANNTTASNSRTNNATTGPNARTNNGTIGPVNNTNDRDYWNCFEDQDGDGFGGAPQSIDTPCENVGLVDVGGDCDDDDATQSPDAAEQCDGVDRDCDDAWSAEVPATCPTIQAALDAAAAGIFTGEINVAPGTYQENIVFGAAAVRLVGAGPDQTTIDGSGADESVVRFEDGEGPDSILEGFTITGGSGRADGDRVGGGGIYIEESSPTLRNLVIRDNRVDDDSGYGGGIRMLRSDALIERVDVIDNRAGYYGGGLYVALGAPTIRQVRVIANEALYGAGLAAYFTGAEMQALVITANKGTFGGGVLMQGEQPAIRWAAIVGNEARDGGGAFVLSDTTATFENVNFSGNVAESGGAIHDEGDAVVEYSNFYDNGASPTFGVTIGPNGDDPPAFVSTAGDPESWDLHLQPSSPLVDAGDPTATDADGSTADIGAYGGPHSDW